MLAWIYLTSIWRVRVKFNKLEPQILKKSTALNTLFCAPFLVPMCLLEQGASRKTIKIEKKLQRNIYICTFQKSCSKRGSGLLKFWHEVGRGARGIIFRTPKKNLLTPQGHFLDICGHQNLFSAKTKSKKLKENFQKVFKKIPTWNVSKTIFNAFFAFSEDFIFFVPRFFFENHDFFFLMIHFSTM